MAIKPAQKKATILVGITGSIAAYKACDVVRRLTELGASVHCIMTEGAKHFIAPLTFSALSGNPVACDMWDGQSWRAAHINLAEEADLFLIAPASADTLARLANGRASDLLSAIALATKAPVVVAPAMHEAMWLKPATQENVSRLKKYGFKFIGPEKGALLGRLGIGRMSDPEKIVKQALSFL